MNHFSPFFSHKSPKNRVNNDPEEARIYINSTTRSLNSLNIDNMKCLARLKQNIKKQILVKEIHHHKISDWEDTYVKVKKEYILRRRKDIKKFNYFYDDDKEEEEYKARSLSMGLEKGAEKLRNLQLTFTKNDLLTHTDIARFRKILANNLRNVENFSLALTNTTEVTDDFLDISKMLRCSLTYLQSLSIEFSHFMDLNINLVTEYAAKLIKNQVKLTKLSLTIRSSSGLKNISLIKLADVIEKRLPFLEEFHLKIHRQDNTKDLAYTPIFEALKGLSKLTKLSIDYSHNNSDQTMGDEEFLALAEGLKGNITKFESLKITAKIGRCTDIGFQAIFKAIKKGIKNIKYLTLNLQRAKKITNNGVKSIVEALRGGSRSLRELSLSVTDLGLANIMGFKGLEGCLKDGFTKLEVINLAFTIGKSFGNCNVEEICRSLCVGVGNARVVKMKFDDQSESCAFDVEKCLSILKDGLKKAEILQLNDNEWDDFIVSTA